jgi:hypothetical protein
LRKICIYFCSASHNTIFARYSQLVQKKLKNSYIGATSISSDFAFANGKVSLKGILSFLEKFRVYPLILGKILRLYHNEQQF